MPPDEARRLDAMAQDISPILFWTCNYEPTQSYSINEDAMFHDGIQDLYKFAIDANCVFKPLVTNPHNGIYDYLLTREEAAGLRRHIDTVQMLRAVIDHNQSKLNGRFSADNLDSFTNWIQSRIGKEVPQSNDDFAILREALDALGADLVAGSEMILNRLRRMPGRREIVEGWTRSVVRWYCIGTRQQYYKGQLADYYIGRAVTRRPRFLENVSQSDLIGKVNRWIRMQVMHEYESLKSEEAKIRELLDHPNPMALRIKAANPEMFEKVQSQQRNDVEEIAAKLQGIECEHAFLRGRYGEDKCGWFFDSKRLDGQLMKTLESLDEQGELYTLLPQSLLQIDVRLNFANVSSPDGDF